MKTELEQLQRKFEQSENDKKRLNVSSVLFQEEVAELRRKNSELEETINTLNRAGSLKNGEFESMRTNYERQLGEKNAEIGLLKERHKELLKRIDMLGLEIAGMKDANDRNSSDKVKEIEKLKAIIEDLNRMIEGLKNNSSDQIK